MCGQYYVEEDYIERMMWIYPQLKKPLAVSPSTGVIKPSLQASVLLNRHHQKALEQMTWGFPAFKGKGLHINARSESVLEKKTFKESVRLNRCAIPATCYYEWDVSKNIIAFHRKDHGLLFFASIHQSFEGAHRFVILTTRANPSVASIHHRMPLVLRDTQDIELWLKNSKDYQTLLNITPNPLEMTYGARQISFLETEDNA